MKKTALVTALLSIIVSNAEANENNPLANPANNAYTAPQYQANAAAAAAQNPANANVEAQYQNQNAANQAQTNTAANLQAQNPAATQAAANAQAQAQAQAQANAAANAAASQEPIAQANFQAASSANAFQNNAAAPASNSLEAKTQAQISEALSQQAAPAAPAQGALPDAAMNNAAAAKQLAYQAAANPQPTVQSNGSPNTMQLSSPQPPMPAPNPNEAATAAKSMPSAAEAQVPPSPSNSSPEPQQQAAKTEPATGNTGMSCEYHIAAEQGTIDGNLVKSWVEKAAVQSFNFNAQGLDAQLTKLKPCYTDLGWQGFNDALKQSGNVEAIKNQNLTVSSLVDGNIQLSSAKENQWKASLPMQVIYQNDKEKLTQLLTVDLLIGRKMSGDLGIMQIIASPRAAAGQAPATSPAAAPAPAAPAQPIPQASNAPAAPNALQNQPAAVIGETGSAPVQNTEASLNNAASIQGPTQAAEQVFTR